MTVTADVIRPTYFDVPDITVRPSQLLDHADVHEGLSFLEPTGLFETYNCLNVGNIAVLPCPASKMAAPVQSASATSTTGGTLAAGTYRAKITAYNSRGETIASNEQSQVTTGATSTVTWNWATVTGATGYKVYVTNGATNSETFLADVGLVLTYLWTGTPAYSAGNSAPPTVNTATVVVTKTDSATSWQDAIRFAAYALLKCKPLGMFGPGLDSGQMAELRRVFEAMESIAVERAIMQQRFIVNGTSWAAATDVTPTPGTAVSPTRALALLEGHAASRYAGVPTIHASAGLVSMLSHLGAIVENGGRFYSKLGSKVISGGGYDNPSNGPTGAAPSAPNQWMYASGGVAVARSEIQVPEPVMKYDSNEVYTLVERQYVAAVDCYTAGVLTSVMV